MNEIISYEASTDSPRREAEVADGYQISCLAMIVVLISQAATVLLYKVGKLIPR